MSHVGTSSNRAARIGILVWAVACLASLPASAEAAPTTADEVIERYVGKKKVQSEMAFIKMQTVAPGRKPEIKQFLALYHTNEERTGFLVRLIRPTEVEGVSVLVIDDDQGDVRQWLYLPTVGMVRPLTGSARSQPFLGSDFSYEDLAREIPGTQEYEMQEGRWTHGADCFVVRATPRDPGSSSYAYRDLVIDKENYNLYQIDYYNDAGDLVKVLSAFDYDSPEIAGQSTRPRRAVMIDQIKKTSTIFTVIVGRIDESIRAEMFTPEFVRSWSPEDVQDFMFQLTFDVGSLGK